MEHASLQDRIVVFGVRLGVGLRFTSARPAPPVGFPLTGAPIGPGS